MIEIIIKTEDEVALQKLLQFIKKIGLEIATPSTTIAEVKVINKEKELTPPTRKIPKIQWAKNPEKAEDFFGVWKDTPLTQQELRNSTWGGRI